jgi:hypothetical protein
MATIPQDLLPSCSSNRIAFSSIEETINYLQQCCRRRDNHSTVTACTDVTAIAGVRDEIFHLGAIVGRLCTFFLSEHYRSLKQRDSNSSDGGVEEKNSTRRASASFWWEEEEASSPSDEVVKVAAHQQLGEVFLQLFVVAGSIGVDLCTSILKKIELNGRKYPVELCKVRSCILVLTASCVT